MNTKILFVLLLLPGLAQAVICKTVGADGVVSFTDVPAAECPPGAAIPDPVQRAAPGERADRVETGTGGREVFPGYRSIAIETPEDGGTVRSNEGRVAVQVALEPGLQADHFVTVYLDGKSFRGRYGSSAVELENVDPGEHELSAEVIDSKGKSLIASKQLTFTLQRTVLKIQVTKIEPNPKRKGEYKISGKFLGPRDSRISLSFPDAGGKTYAGTVDDNGAWTVDVGSEPAVEAIRNRLAATVVTPANATFDRVVEVKQIPFANANYGPTAPGSYGTTGSPDYSPSQGGISTTPGQTNPAFQPKYTP